MMLYSGASNGDIYRMNNRKQLLCIECAKLHNPAQMCPVHPEEPLLDPDDDDVRFELMNLDDRARSRTYTRWMIGLGGLGLVLATAGYFLFKIYVNGVIEAFWAETIGGGVVGGGFIGFLVARKTYKPRFAQWTKDGEK